MQSLIETLIYLLGIFGIIFTSISLIEIFNYRNYSSYKVFSKNCMKNRKAEIIINISGFDEEEEEELINTLLKGEYYDLESVVDCVRVEKDSNNE